MDRGGKCILSLSNNLVQYLHNVVIFSLGKSKAQDPQEMGWVGLKNEELWLEGELVAEWHKFVGLLCSSFIRLRVVKRIRFFGPKTRG
jgi:hypothetical protein